MTTTCPNELVDKLNWRYAVKKFDPTKKCSSEQWEQLKKALILSPSSYGLQPYKFILVQNPDLRKALFEASWKQSQVLDCSHFVVFAGLKKVTEEYVKNFVQLTATTQGTPVEKLAGLQNVIIGDLVKGPRSAIIDHWAARQTYIALGNLLTSAALMDVDACPMEGLVPPQYDEILKLKDSPYQTLVACALGFRSADDHTARRKKVRFPAEDLVEIK